MMHLIHGILTFAVVASALPSRAQDSDQPQLIGVDGALMTSGQCRVGVEQVERFQATVGQHYCFSQIIGDLSISCPNSARQASLTLSRSFKARHPPPVLRSAIHDRLAELQHMQKATSSAA